MEHLLELCDRDVSDEPVKASLVMPVDSPAGPQLEIFNTFRGPGVARSSDEFSLAISVHCERCGTSKEVIDAANEINSANLCEMLPTVNGCELTAGVLSAPQSGYVLAPGPPRHLDCVENGFCLHV